MYRLLAFLLSLLLLCPLSLTANAADKTFVLTLYGADNTRIYKSGSAYTLPEPDTVPDGKVFVGWRSEDSSVLLPVGAAFSAKEDTALYAAFVGMTTREDPMLRLSDGYGIRFLTDIDKVDFSALTAAGRVKQMGTVIVPRAYATAAGERLTPAALSAAGKSSYLKAVATAFYGETESALTLAGSVTQIRPENDCIDYAAAGYLLVSYTDGSTGYISAPVATDCFYTMVSDAYCDRSTAADAVHSQKTDGGFSPYSAEALSYFNTVLDRVVNLNTSVGNGISVSSLPDSSCYTSPFAVVYDALHERFVLTVRAGREYRFDRDMGTLILNGEVVMTGWEQIDICTLSADGTVLYIASGEYSPNY